MSWRLLRRLTGPANFASPRVCAGEVSNSQRAFPRARAGVVELLASLTSRPAPRRERRCARSSPAGAGRPPRTSLGETARRRSCREPRRLRTGRRRRRFQGCPRLRSALARRSARGRRRSARAGPRSAASRRSRLTSFQPMCGSFSEPCCSSRTSPPITPRPGVPPCSVERSKPSCMPRQIPSTGVPAARRSRKSSSKPSSRSLTMPRGKAPTPGTTRPAAARRRSWSFVMRHIRADVRQRLLDRAAVAHAVVDDGDVDGLVEQAHEVSVPFVLGTPLSVGSSATAWRRARAKALNAASIM